MRLRSWGAVVVAGLLLAGCRTGSPDTPAAGVTPPGPRRSPSATMPAEQDVPPSRRASGRAAERDGRQFVIWAPGGVPARLEPILESVPSVEDVTAVVGGLRWVERLQAGGGPPEKPRAGGYRIPIEVAFVDGAALARFVAPDDAAAVRSLRGHRGVWARTARDLRGWRMGIFFDHEGNRWRTVGDISDGSAMGFEAVFAGPAPRGWGDRYLLVDGGTERRLERAARRVFRDRPFAVEPDDAVPFLRYAHSVVPQLLYKEAFGEFAARAGRGGTVAIDPAWRKRNIIEREVPLLGTVTCHRKLVPQLRRALGAIARAGLGGHIDTGDFGGCYGPRFIGRDPGGRLSTHAWGAAVDLNVTTNALGAEPTIDEAIVNIMVQHGFDWGGTWLIPDGMHFEWARWLD